MNPGRKRSAKSKVPAGRRTAPAKAKAAALKAHAAVAAASGAEAHDAAAGLVRNQVIEASTMLFQGYDEIAILSRRNVDAVMQSGDAVARAIEGIGAAWLELGQHSWTEGVAAAKAFAAAQTLQEVFELQAELIRVLLDRLFDDTLRISEISANAANEAVAPLQTRISEAIDGALSRAAA